MKILHVMRQEKFTKRVSQLYSMRFNNGEHELLYINNDKTQPITNDDIEIPQREIFIDDYSGCSRQEAKTITDVMKEYDYVVLHSMFINDDIIKRIVRNRTLLKKIVWIEWGYDLYDWKVQIKSLADRFRRRRARIIRTECYAVICIFPPDRKFYKERFPKASAHVFYAPYIGPKRAKRFKNYSEHRKLTESRENGDTIYIQIGNRAYNRLRHIDALKKLEKFKDENIHLIIPLSYGREGYADRVQRYAEEHFPGKVTCIKEFLPVKEYNEILSKADIAVFNAVRQIGLNSINTLIFNNVKIFIPSESVLFRYLRWKGVPIQNFDRINEMDFDEFISDFEIEKPDMHMEYIKDLCRMKEKVMRWKRIYSRMRNDMGNKIYKN